MINKLGFEFYGRELTFETGHLAKQANGAVLVRYADTVVLVTVVADYDMKEPKDFLPLTVDYQEMSYAAGRIPGGFFRREIGRPSEKEILTSRLIDRPIRPLFPEGYFSETQIIATVLSVDPQNDPDILALNGASAALVVSDVPFYFPIAGVRIGRINGEFIVNPTTPELSKSDLNMVVAGSRDSIIMVEGSAKFLSEEEMIEAILFAHKAIQPILDLQEELMDKCGKEKIKVELPPIDEVLKEKVEAIAIPLLKEAIRIAGKKERQRKYKETKIQLKEELLDEFPDSERDIDNIFSELKRKLIRELVLKEKKRIDGRGFSDIRPITCEVGLLPRTHGSALFTRGETQAMVTTTLGTSSDEQKIESLMEGETFKSFMVHYNFPPYSVGEVKRLKGPSRREIGHGGLSERALSPILPPAEEFPYTIRIVSEILESNGSSSMATVCGGSLSLMDAGIPVKEAVSGIAMGLVKEGDEEVILSDIIGDEDHCGDMDFKVAGTKSGITALQMDIKIKGLSEDILSRALKQAKEGRLFILEKMNETISTPRETISRHAPKITTLDINPEKIKDLIGPAGKNIKHIIAATGVKIDIEDSGKVNIFSMDSDSAEKAIDMIKEITQEAKVGQVYHGKVKRVMDFGAFVEIFPGTEGLVHISELDHHHVRRVSDIVKEGDEVDVKVLDIDDQGKIKLSRKALIEPPKPTPPNKGKPRPLSLRHRDKRPYHR